VNCPWGEGGTVMDLSGCFVEIYPEEEKIIGIWLRIVGWKRV
jgi:hypothetical protein